MAVLVVALEDFRAVVVQLVQEIHHQQVHLKEIMVERQEAALAVAVEELEVLVIQVD
jgi:hypothetical protein